jgi:hypothetical protein
MVKNQEDKQMNATVQKRFMSNICITKNRVHARGIDYTRNPCNQLFWLHSFTVIV